MLCPRFSTRQDISKVEQENVYKKTLIISIRKRVLQKSQIKVSKSSHIWESSAYRLWKTIAKIQLIRSDRRGKSSLTSHLYCAFYSLVQMLTNVPMGHMIVTSMPDCGNTVGSFTCTCKPTYFGNGKICTSFREFYACHICNDYINW